MTPLIDVVFILLVFFMLVTRLVDWGRLDISVIPGHGGAADAGKPAVVRVLPEILLWAGERYPSPATLADALAARAAAHGAVYLDPAPETRLQRLVDTLTALRDAGIGDAQLLNRSAGGD